MEVNMRRGCRIALFPVKGAKGGEKEREEEKNMSRQERIQAINCALEAGLSVMYVLTAKDRVRNSLVRIVSIGQSQ